MGIKMQHCGKIISVFNVSKNYGNNTIFKDVNIVFPDKKINFILGRNGVGKTTLYKCILGLENYDGLIETDGRIYCVYDEQPFYLNLSGLDNIELYKAMYNITEISAIDNSFLDMELLKKKVKHYSYGQRKKLALLLADIIHPRIILLDEASNGLDYETIKYLKSRLMKWKEDLTVLVTGHQLDFYNSVVDNVYVMKEGKLVEVGNLSDSTLEDIYEKYL